jgi:hypothetical protein
MAAEYTTLAGLNLTAEEHTSADGTASALLQKVEETHSTFQAWEPEKLYTYRVPKLPPPDAPAGTCSKKELEPLPYDMRPLMANYAPERLQALVAKLQALVDEAQQQTKVTWVRTRVPAFSVASPSWQ